MLLGAIFKDRQFVYRLRLISFLIPVQIPDRTFFSDRPLNSTDCYFC